MNENHRDEVLFVVIPEYADWEPSILAPGLRRGFGLWEPRHEVKVVAPNAEAATSIGGFRCLPDYTFETIPDDFAALVLVGGMGWWGAEAERVVPLVERALACGTVIGAICDASMFLGAHGFLNDVEHTSNDLRALKEKAGPRYTGEKLYRKEPAVVGEKIVTANGAAFVDFACAMFAALEVAPTDKIEMVRTAFKTGFFPEL